MKISKSHSKGAIASYLFLIAAAVTLLATPSKAATTPVWGTTDAGFFSYFGFTHDWTALEVGTNPVTLSNQSSIDGNFGIAGSTTGTTALTLANQSKVNQLFLNSNAKKITESVTGGSTVTKTTATNLSNDITAATNAANYFKALPDSSTSTWSSSNSSLSSKLELGLTKGQLSLSGGSQALTLTAKSTTPVVFNINNFSLNNGAVLTLSGNATDEFVFNIYGGYTVNNSSQIKLTGGLTPSDVVYNILGSGNCGSQISGPQISCGSKISGIILATQQQVQISNQSKVIGAVISAGLQVCQSEIESADN